MGMVRYVLNEVKRHRLMSYSDEYSETALKIGGVDHQITAEEHAKMSEVDFKENYTDLDTHMEWYFKYLSNIKKTPVLSTVASVASQNGYKNILSIGCGPGCLEYMIAMMLGKEYNIIGADYDSYIVDQNNTVMGDRVRYISYDLYKDDVVSLTEKYETDMVLLVGSSCSMDGDSYIKWLKNLTQTGVKCLIDFAAGVDNAFMFLTDLSYVKKATISYLQGRRDGIPIEAAHAYRRYSFQLTDIFDKGGWDYKRISAEPYKHVYVLSPKGKVRVKI